MGENRDGRRTRKVAGGLRLGLAIGVAVGLVLLLSGDLQEALADPPPQKVTVCIDSAPPSSGYGRDDYRVSFRLYTDWFGWGGIQGQFIMNTTPPRNCHEFSYGQYTHLDIYNHDWSRLLLNDYPVCCSSVRFDCNADRCWKK